MKQVVKTKEKSCEWKDDLGGEDQSFFQHHLFPNSAQCLAGGFNPSKEIFVKLHHLHRYL